MADRAGAALDLGTLNRSGPRIPAGVSVFRRAGVAMVAGTGPVLGEFPAALERLVDARPGDPDPFRGAGGTPAVLVRTLFGELRALHEAVAGLGGRVSALEQQAAGVVADAPNE